MLFLWTTSIGGYGHRVTIMKSDKIDKLRVCIPRRHRTAIVFCFKLEGDHDSPRQSPAAMRRSSGQLTPMQQVLRELDDATSVSSGETSSSHAGYVVQSDGSLRFFKSASKRSSSLLAKSVPGTLHSLAGALARSQRARALAPLVAISDATPTADRTLAVGHECDRAPPRHTDSPSHPTVSPLRGGGGGQRGMSLEEAMGKGKLAPPDADIQRAAVRGVRDIRDEGDARLSVPSSSLGLRQSALALEASLEERFNALKAKSAQMSRFELGQRAQRVFNEVMYELIRQVGVQCAERAKLLAHIWVRSSDIINALSAMFVEERERHTAEESKWKEELRCSRRDYLVVVQRLEQMVVQESEAQTALMTEADARESALCDQIAELKDELHATKAQLRQMELDQKFSLFQKPRELGRADEYGLAKVLLPGSAGSTVASSVSGAEESHSPEATQEEVARLKAELHRQRILLLGAAEEIRKLRGEIPTSRTVACEAAPDVVEIGSDPVDEIATESESEEEEENSRKAPGTKAARGTKGKTKRK